MRVSCLICTEIGDGVRGVKCDTGGNVEWTGLLLYTFYNTDRKVRDLISCGGIIELGARIGVKVDVSRYTPNNAEYYFRHRLTSKFHVREIALTPLS